MQKEVVFMNKIPSKKALTEALSAAGSAHHDYEQKVLNGVRDEQWAGFYAAYVLGKLGDFAPASALNRWLEEAPGDDQWTATAAVYVLGKLNQ